MKKPKAELESTVLGALSRSKIYRDYEDAFTAGTGLPLTLRGPRLASVLRHANGHRNPFCELMASASPTCAKCLSFQRDLEKEGQQGAKTQTCFAGLCESTVPVRCGNETAGFLQTGQVMLTAPTSAKFSRLSRDLIRWGAELNLKDVERAYFQTRVLTSTQYEALVQLLVIFAEHLGIIANTVLVGLRSSESDSIARARTYIEANSSENLRLAEVAEVVNMSASYLSKRFHKTVGMSFVEFLGRHRIERARELLEHPSRRISEVAFAVGFQSISQFNRSFKRYVGQSPRGYRMQMEGAAQ